MDINWKEIGLRIKNARESKLLTQTDLASKIGKTESSVRKYEAGLTEVPLSVLANIAKTLDLKVYSILGFELDFFSGLSFDTLLEASSNMDDEGLDQYLKDLGIEKTLSDMSIEEKIEFIVNFANTGIGMNKLERLFTKDSSFTEKQKADLRELIKGADDFYILEMNRLLELIREISALIKVQSNSN